MNPAIKPRWIERLRSGKYEQGKRTMNRRGRFCCLGVLMEIAVVDGVVTKRAPQGAKSDVEYFDAMPSGSKYGVWASPSSAARNWAGLSDDEVNHLAGLNDGGVSFSQIADYVEENL